MVKLSYGKTQGKCFAKSIVLPCKIMDEPDVFCGTFNCPFYKPEDLKDWIRRDCEDGVLMIPPEEYSIEVK